MSSRERVLKTIRKEMPDRPPLFVTATPQVAEKLANHLGMPCEEPLDSLLSSRISHMDLLTAMENDCVGVAACAPHNRPTIEHKNGIIENTYGNDLVFFGGIDIQELLPNGSPEEIREEVLRLSGIYGRDGGYIIAPAHNIQDDTPVENIEALFDAVKNL